MTGATPQKGNPYGGIIDLSAGGIIAKAPRGATKTFDSDLVEHLSQIDATTAVEVNHPDFIVKRDALGENGKRLYAATDAGEIAFKNERQRIGAVLRSHAQEAGIGKISINWHPEGDFPQCSLKA